MGPIEDLGKAINGIAEGAGRSTVGIGNRWRGGSGVVVLPCEWTTPANFVAVAASHS